MIIYITKGLFDAQKKISCHFAVSTLKVARVFLLLLREGRGRGWCFNSILKMKLYRVTESSYTWVLETVELL